MTRRVRRVTGPRLRYIVAGELGAVEYMTLAGLPLAVSCHSPRPADGAGPVACDVLEGPCYGDGTVLGAWELCERWRAAGKDDEVIWRALEERYSRGGERTPPPAWLDVRGEVERPSAGTKKLQSLISRPGPVTWRQGETWPIKETTLLGMPAGSLARCGRGCCLHAVRIPRPR